MLDEGAQVFAICSTHSWTPVRKQSHTVCSQSTGDVLRGPWTSLSSLSFASQCSSLQGNSTWLEWYTLTCSSKNSLYLVFTASNTLPLQVVACKQVLPHFPVNWLEVINYAIKSFLVHNFTLYLKALGNTRSASQTFSQQCLINHVFRHTLKALFADSAVLPEKVLQTQFATLIQVSLSSLLVTIIWYWLL